MAKKLGPNLDVKYYRFDSTLREEPSASSEKAKEEPIGRETALGAALLEAVKRQAGTQSRRAGRPLRRLEQRGPESRWSPHAGSAASRSRSPPSASARRAPARPRKTSRSADLTAGPTVFVKNQLQIEGPLVVRGFPKQPIEVEMLVDDKPVAKTTLEAP